ncbi:hypothetical protein PLCT2_01407 [Planctomycetaceae bacterium]|nr:hypothetical protein PLCT2_01407 [Planctomycetaceae bacterium]
MLGSKKRGDYCWSVFSGEAYRPLGVGTEEPAPICKPASQSAQKPGGSEPPPKPV